MAGVIARDAEPIYNRSPYRPIDVSGRKPAHPAVITADDIRNGAIPDPALYEYWVGDAIWRLKP